MPRTYKCRKCGISHESPTGKQCQRQRQEPQNEGEGAAALATLMPMMLEVKEQMQEFREQLHGMASSPAQGAQGGPREESEDTEEVENSDDDSQANAQTLRQDMRLMSQAAQRLGRLRIDDSDEDELEGAQGGRRAGKKSGSVLTPTDLVKKRIDWPHLYVSRMSRGRSGNVSYPDMRVDEFVFGFLSMIEAPNCRWDYRTMTRILRHLMQDSMEFSWTNALNFYEMAGIEVEKGRLRWSDRDRLHEMRMTYSRAVFPMVREPREPRKTQLQTAPANMKCCVPFQHHTCEHERDHAPFTHGCAYCFKARNALCRHPEDDCKRKQADAKNGRPREA